jgi:hypothetical protein
MKTTILLIIYATIIAASENQAFSQIENHGRIDLGWKNGAQQYFQGANIMQFQYPENTFYADIKLSLKWKFITFDQSLNNNFYYKDGTTFNPLDIDFVSTLTVQYKKLSIGYTHNCLHPVISDKDDLEQGYRRGGEDKVFLRYEW